MKKSMLVFALILGISATAQNSNVELKLNPIALAFNMAAVGVEVPIKGYDNATFNSNLFYWQSFGGGWMKTYGASMGIRKYLNQDTDNGFFIGGASRYVTLDESWGNNRWTTSYISVGATFGMKHTWNRITVDYFGGIGRAIPLDDNGGIYVDPIVGFNFGYKL